MGFRCPVCKTDFGRDRAALAKHLETCELGSSVASLVLNAADDQEAKIDLGLSIRGVFNGLDSSQAKK